MLTAIINRPSSYRALGLITVCLLMLVSILSFTGKVGFRYFRLRRSSEENRSHKLPLTGRGHFHRQVNSRQWIVVSHGHRETASVSAAHDLSFLDSIADWTSVIVGGASGETQGCAKCLVVSRDESPESQTESPLQTALLMAIARGARKIYLMTSLHNVTEAIARMETSQASGLIYTGERVFNPCSHFSQPVFGTNRSFGNCYADNWPYSYRSGDFPPSVVLGLCGRCGAVSKNFPSGEIHCDSATPNVVVKPGSYTKGLFENTLWNYQSFWALFVHVLQERNGDENRCGTAFSSFLTQKLLWEVQISVGFVRSHDLTLPTESKVPFDKSNKTSEKGICADTILSPQETQLLRFLSGWLCLGELDIYECVSTLVNQLHNSQFISEADVYIVSSFLSGLVTTGYEPPPRVPKENNEIISFVGSRVNSIHAWPSTPHRMWSENPFRSLCSKIDPDQYSKDMAATGEKHINNGKSKDKIGGGHSIPPPVSDILLLIVFKVNDAATQIQMAQYFDFMYGRHFKHIIYCTSGAGMIHLFAKMYPHPMTVIDLKTKDHRLFPYMCASEAMKMRHEVKGYLHVDSDALFNPWSVGELLKRPHVPWLSRYVFPAKLTQMEVQSPTGGGVVGWSVWNDADSGKIALHATLQELQFVSKAIQKYLSETGSNNSKNKNSRWILNARMVGYLEQYNSIIRHFLKRFPDLNRASVHYGNTALFYVPTRLRESFMVLSDEFYRFKVHADLVVPTVLHALSHSIAYINGSVAWTTHTSQLISSYRSAHVFLCPWQLYMMGAQDRARFMCHVYLPKIETSLIELLQRENTERH